MADKSKGYILLHRTLWDNPLFENERYNKMTAWMYLVSTANYKKGSIRTTGGVVTLERGQLYTTIRHLSHVFQWDPKTVMRFLKELCKLEMVTQDRSSHGTLLTIVNYNKYQSFDDEEHEQGNTKSHTVGNTGGNTVGNTDSTLLNTNRNTDTIQEKEKKKETRTREQIFYETGVWVRRRQEDEPE